MVEKKKKGRPSKYSEEIANRICEELTTSSKGIHAICKGEGMPSPSTVFKWLSEIKDFSDKYARAKELQADYMVEEIIDIVDDDKGDIIEGSEGYYPNNANVQRSKLKADARKWLASKLAAKKYGDKVQTEHSGSVGITQITGMEIK